LQCERIGGVVMDPDYDGSPNFTAVDAVGRVEKKVRKI
jgi:hypothetical protein